MKRLLRKVKRAVFGKKNKGSKKKHDHLLKFLTSVSESTGMDLETVKAMGISRRFIRTAVEKVGWEPFEAFQNMLSIAKNSQVDFETIAKRKLWRDYRHEMAELIAESKSDKNEFSDNLVYEDFYKYYYTSSQRQAIESIREGVITVEALQNLMEVEFPEEVASLEGDVKRLVSFKLTAVKEGGIFICAADKYIVKETLERMKPACVVGYPEYREVVESAGIAFVPCKHTGAYVNEIAALWKQNFDVKTVGITGSVGKTSTTGMIGRVVRSSFKMHKVTGNQNTTWQIANFIMRLNERQKVFVQEGSGSYNGQMERTSKMLKADIFVLTNIGTGHLANYSGMQERLLYEKLSLDRHASEDAVGVINWDDPLLKKVQYRHRIRSFAVEDKTAEFWADNIVENDGFIEFDVVEEKYRTHVKLNTIGTHNVYNALAAFVVGVELGIRRRRIARALGRFETTGARQNLTEYDGRKLYIDCLSATEESMRTAVEAMKTIEVDEDKRKIAILADISYLGEREQEAHRNVGRMADEVGSADEVIFYGPLMKLAWEEYSKSGKKCRHTESQAELEEWLRKDTKPGDLITIKAGHAAKCLWMIDDVYGTFLFVDDKFVANDPIKTIGNNAYKFIHDYGCVQMKGDKTEKNVVIPDELEGMEVRTIYINVYRKSMAESVVLGKNIRCISKACFRGSEALSKVEFPEGLQLIGEEAFRDCTALEEIDLSKGCSSIDSKAFKGCSGLKRIYLPENLLTIRDDAFDEEFDAEVYVKPGSYAESYADEKGWDTLSY